MNPEEFWHHLSGVVVASTFLGCLLASITWWLLNLLGVGLWMLKGVIADRLDRAERAERTGRPLQ